jgi:alpha-N-arabinofuranosidase
LVQEALDGLEYALGPVASTWGSRRAANGHPAPFPLRYIEIGNETSGAVYQANYRQFEQAIREKYPEVTIISAMPFKDMPMAMVDHHKYGTPDDFFNAHRHYDSADRTGPKVYVGEYGVTVGVGSGNLLAALAEAVYVLGLERNSDLVTMASYAPLFFPVDDIQWPVNMIGFDSSRVAPRSSYYILQQLAANRPDEVLSTELDRPQAGLFALAGILHATGSILIRVVNRDVIPHEVQISLAGLPTIASRAQITTISHDDPTVENSVDYPDAILPVTTVFDGAGANFRYIFAPNSFTVIKLEQQP